MDVPPKKLIRLRYDGNCVHCNADLPAGTKAWWDRPEKQITCVGCRDSKQSDGKPEPETTATSDIIDVTDSPTFATAFSRGTAGRSAERVAARKRARDQKTDEATRTAHPVIGTLLVGLRGKSRWTKSWEKGAAGERKLGLTLEELVRGGAVVLHDRRIPGSAANIDHLIVSAAGVHIVDAKFYEGKVECRKKGGWFSPNTCLYVGGRDQTKLIVGLTKQILAVGNAASDLIVSYGTSVYPALCFIDATWDKIFFKGFVITGVQVLPRKRLCKWINRPGSLSSEQVNSLALRLAERLPEA